MHHSPQMKNKGGNSDLHKFCTNVYCLAFKSQCTHNVAILVLNAHAHVHTYVGCYPFKLRRVTFSGTQAPDSTDKG